MGLMRHLITKCLAALVVLVFKLVLADTICSFVNDWMIYYIVERKHIVKPNPGYGEGLKVIICGFPRSGTTTLKVAMTILGFPCFHAKNLYEPTQCMLYMKARKCGKQEDWNRLLKGYTSISDFPAADYYKQLMKLYPNSKVILNIRDPSKWYKSYCNTIINRRDTMHLLHSSGTFQFCVREVVAKDMFKGKEKVKELAIHTYNLHTKEVMAHVQPQSRLLVYDLEESSEGWAPLCKFLGVEVPCVPFPHANDSQSFQRGTFTRTIICSFVVASYFTLLGFIAFLILKLLG